MSVRALGTITALVTVFIPLQTFCASLNAKPGAWQLSTNTFIVGNPLSEEALASMPAEKRARVEKAMKERAAKPVTRTSKACMTQDDLNQGRVVSSSKDDDKCTRKVLSRSATRLVMEQICPGPNGYSSQMTIEANTPDRLSANIVRVRADGKGKVLLDVQGFWLGPNCAVIRGDD